MLSFGAVISLDAGGEYTYIPTDKAHTPREMKDLFYASKKRRHSLRE